VGKILAEARDLAGNEVRKEGLALADCLGCSFPILQDTIENSHGDECHCLEFCSWHYNLSVFI
jgi:hypothetical protein